MFLKKYLDSLEKEKREVLLGRETQDPLHEAFRAKRVVHAGLLGEPVPKGQGQETWAKAMEEPADASRQHAVYIHIPFCQTKCLYCGFFQNVSRQSAEDEYIDDLLTEMRRDAQKKQLQTAKIDSVYIGGGTPTSLSPANVTRLLQGIHESFHLAADCELTLEGRIHDLVPEKIDAWLKGGVNRISLGVQSFDTAIRRRVGRLDTREEVLRRLKLLKEHDVTVIVDLIYGLPGQTKELWLDDIKTLLTTDVDGMDLYQLNIFPGGDLEKALQSGKIPACADIAGQADLYIAARDFLMGEGIERLSLCHWRRHKREHSRYNTMAKTGAAIYPFGCGAGGNFGGLTFMQQRKLQAYSQAVRAGRKPIMMMAHQVEQKLQQTSDTVIANLETGFLDFRQLCLTDSRLEELEIVLDLWKKRGLMQEDLGICRLTKAGEFWYISLTQSLIECMQVICQPEETASAPTEEGESEDALDACLAEMMPGSTFAERSAMVRKIPLPVRMMLKRSSKDALKNMLAGLPPAMLKRMLNKASD
ncbi:heme anaerobic degradation radical SAM methyltransferase ChuW/HutW [Mitsuokella sp. WILCCON 0060]|uniref:heme anaerobic degradation radical SAM methyltransferase ChuW/HutW n=1 Tax=Mitsuokella sp. WILCCON 0060 TaxID=3345341 RepID=UPI003F1A13EF